MTKDLSNPLNTDIARQAQRAAADLKQRFTPLNDVQLDFLFKEARSQNGWLDTPVTDEQLNELYALTKMGSTSMNCCPARFIFIRTAEGKEKLKPALAEGNIEKVTAAPVIVIIGHDMKFYDHMPKLFPHRDVRELFTSNPDMTAATAFRNGTLQGAYLMLAARAIGLDCGPMSGFSNAKVNEIFFAGTEIKSNFLCCLGHGDHRKLFQRLPRFELNDVCELI